MNRRYRVSEIIILFVLGMAPLLWFKGNFLIDGADLDLSLRPVIEFLSRARTWNAVYQGGCDNVLNLSTLVYSGIQALFYLVTRSVLWAEKLSFVFWFMFSLFSIYALVNSLILKGRPFLVKLAPCLFYQFNFYQLVCWSEVHIAGITALAVLPVLFLLFVKILDGDRRPKSIISFSLFSIFSAGIWVNPPTAVVFGIIFLSYFVFHISGLIRCGRRPGVKIAGGGLLLLGILYLLLNSYILIPFMDKFILNAGAGQANPLKGYDVFGSLQFQSEYSSPLNVLRMMGRSDLYAVWKTGEHYYPFFVKYMVKRRLILGSFILPVFAFLGAVLCGKNRFSRYFFWLAVAGIILGIGIHFPMEYIYKWMAVHIPLFYLFRQPWLKFGFFTLFGYSILAGLFCSRAYEYIRSIFHKRGKKIASNGFVLGVMALYLLFMHSFIFGEMYTPKERRDELNPMYIKLPPYIGTAAEWINNKKGDFTVLPLPKGKADIYDWGYRGITDVLAKLIDKKMLWQGWGQMGAPAPMAQLYRLFARAVYNEATYSAVSLLNLIGARYIVERNDIKYYFYGNKDSPAFIKEKLNKQKDISYKRSFGKWDLYANDSWQDNFIYPCRGLVYVQHGKIPDLIPLSELKYTNGASLADSAFLLGGGRYYAGIKKFCAGGGYTLLINPEYIGDGRNLQTKAGRTGILLCPKDSRGTLKFREKRLWIGETGYYRVFIKLRAEFRKLMLERGKKIIFSPADLLKWAYKANNTEYKKGISGGVLVIDTVFNGSKREDEYVRLRKEGLSIDVEKYPWFVMNYKVDNPEIQMIEVIFGVDFGGDGKADAVLRGFYTKKSAGGYSKFRINIRREIQHRFYRRGEGRIVFIEIYPHKWWKADCRGRDLNGRYYFWIKDVRFTKLLEKDIPEVFRYWLNYGRKNIKITNIEEGRKSVSISVPLPAFKPMLYPEVKISYRFRYPAGVEKAGLFLQMQDACGRNKVLPAGIFPVINGYGSYRINILRLKNDADFFKGWSVKGIEFRFSGRHMKGKGADMINIRRVEVFKSLFVSGPRRMKGKEKEVLAEIGGNYIYMPVSNGNNKVPRDIAASKKVYLRKGWNKLKLSLDEDDLFKSQWIGVLPDVKNAGKIPSLKYEKFNETLYRVKAKGCRGPFILVMRNNYNSKWRAYLMKGKRRIPLKQHFKADGFANAWLVQNGAGDSEILIKYYPQDLFKWGILVPLIGGIGILGFVIVRRRNRS